MPYSMPLWIIFVKCPLPTGPVCSHPRSGAGASISTNGRTPANASSISDDRNNVHWLIARGGRAHTLDVIVLGIDEGRPEFEIDNLDAEAAEPAGEGLLRMPKLSVEQALHKYGHDHHAP